MKIADIIAEVELAKQAVAFLFGLLSTAIGFFLALYFNKKIENKKDLQSFNNIKKSIISEIAQNEAVVKNSFFKYIDGVILNELNTTISAQQLTNNNFLKFAKPQLLITMQNYIRMCDLCNKQKDQLKDFRIFNSKSIWINNLQDSLDQSLQNAMKSMIALHTQLTSF